MFSARRPTPTPSSYQTNSTATRQRVHRAAARHSNTSRLNPTPNPPLHPFNFLEATISSREQSPVGETTHQAVTKLPERPCSAPATSYFSSGSSPGVKEPKEIEETLSGEERRNQEREAEATKPSLKSDSSSEALKDTPMSSGDLQTGDSPDNIGQYPFLFQSFFNNRLRLRSLGGLGLRNAAHITGVRHQESSSSTGQESTSPNVDSPGNVDGSQTAEEKNNGTQGVSKEDSARK